MTRKLFGTDGIRGRANVEPMTAETALKVDGGGAGVPARGRAAAFRLRIRRLRGWKRLSGDEKSP